MSRHDPPHEPNGHDAFADALALYALDALDDGADRDALVEHLQTCPACRDELAALRRTTTALGVGIEPEAPRAALRDRVLHAATTQSSPVAHRPAATEESRTSASRPPVGAGQSASGVGSGARWPWLVAAAAAVVAAGAIYTAYTLQQELDTARQLVDQASARAEALRTEVVELRLQASELGRVLNVIGAPDVRLASMAGEGAADGALAHAYWSRTKGLVFQAHGLPRLDATRVLQMWALPKGGQPVSIGMLRIHDDGSSHHSWPIDALPAATGVAITLEPAGGSPAPTSAPVMAGILN